MRVILIDESPVFREGLKAILTRMREITVVGEADSFREILDKIRHECELVVIDGELEALNLLRTLDKPNRKGRPPFVLILSAHSNDHHACQMFGAGADGYLPKSETLQSLVEAIRKVSRGAKYIRPEEADSLILNLGASTSQRLSTREYEVLCLMASGLGATEIAGRLSLSVKTVSTYRSRLLEKLHLRSNAELMRYAYLEGIMT
jgi:two-component system invasion response regulator UvrY